jgi:type II secretory pathway component PulK
MTNLLHRARSSRRGAAMVIAISLLALASVLGTVYIKGMMLEVDTSNYALREARARALAQGGITLALEELKQAADTASLLAETQKFTFPAYKSAWNGESFTLETQDNRTAQAEVSLSDESGKIDVNQAPPAVLAAILGLEQRAAVTLHAAIHATGASLKSVDELVSPRPLPLLTKEQFAAANSEDLSVFSGLEAGGAYLNVNAASPAVLAAVLGISAEAAQSLPRPFPTVEDVLQKAGKTAEALPMPVTALTVESRCFRLVSAGLYASTPDEERTYDRARSRTEAIVRLVPDQPHLLLRWDVLAAE